MDSPRLTAKFWVQAYLRQLHGIGIAAFVVRHGDDLAGQVLVKLNLLGPGCHVFERSFAIDGARVWRRVFGVDPVAEAEADRWLAKQHSFDPDLWIVEVEDAKGRHMLDRPIIG